MSYEIEGSIKLIGETQTFGSKGFTKREIVVTTSAERFPQDIALEFVGEKTTMLDSFAAGQQVKISFDLRGREYNGKHFVNLTGWRIDSADGSSGGSRSSSGPPRQQSGGNARPQQEAKAKEFTEEDFNQQSSSEEYPF